MSVKPRGSWLVAVFLAVAVVGETVLACHTCKQTPCVIEQPAAPALECVTEMVPFTVMKTKTRVDLVPVCTKTVMETKIETDYDEQVREVCRPVFDTVFESRCVTVCRPVCEVTMVCRPYRVCRPVTTTYQLTEYCLKPYTEMITVPVKTRCGRCSILGGGCTCTALARSCYRRVPVVREVTETHMVTEIQTEMVPVVHWRLLTEQRIERVPVTICRMVTHQVRVRVPRLVFKCVPKSLVYKTAVLSCEEIPVTVYRPVVKMVPVVGTSPQVSPSSQYSASPFSQIGTKDSKPGPSPQPQQVREKSRQSEKPRQPEKPKSLGTTAAPV